MSPIFGEETDPTISWLEQVGKPHVAYVMQEGGAWESIEAAGKPVQVVELDAVLARWDAHAAANHGAAMDVQVVKGLKFVICRTWNDPDLREPRNDPPRYVMSGPLPVPPSGRPVKTLPLVSTSSSLAELQHHLMTFFRLYKTMPSVEVEF